MWMRVPFLEIPFFKAFETAAALLFVVVFAALPIRSSDRKKWCIELALSSYHAITKLAVQ